jgi:hypothetical protein
MYEEFLSVLSRMILQNNTGHIIQKHSLVCVCMSPHHFRAVNTILTAFAVKITLFIHVYSCNVQSSIRQQYCSRYTKAL